MLLFCAGLRYSFTLHCSVKEWIKMSKVKMDELYLGGKLGKLVKQLREKKEFTQEGLAEEIGVHVNTIKKVENGCCPHMETFRRLNDFFGNNILLDFVFLRIGMNDNERKFHVLKPSEQEWLMYVWETNPSAQQKQ